MFQFPGLPPLRVSGLQPDGFPHSDICGLTLVCNSPQLFAAYHVLHRLREPRHPPYALVLLPILVYLFYIYSFLLSCSSFQSSLLPFSSSFNSPNFCFSDLHDLFPSCQRTFYQSYSLSFPEFLQATGFTFPQGSVYYQPFIFFIPPLENDIFYLLSICWFVDLSICQFVTFNFQLSTFNFQLLTSFKWRIRESNPWPLECKSSALASWANPPFSFYLPGTHFYCSLGRTWTADPYIISVVL